MIKEEKITKDGQGISRRLNELGIKLKDVEFFDWNPMFVIMLYEAPDQTQEQIAKLEQDNAQLRARKTG